MSFRVWGVALCFLIASSGTAAEKREGARIYGAGATSCGQYLEARAQNPSSSAAINVGLMQWFWGYASAYNMYSKTPQYTVTIDGATVLAYVDRYCRNNPLSAATDAMVKLVESNGAP